MNTFKFRSVAQVLTSAVFAVAGSCAMAAVPVTWNLSTDCNGNAVSGTNLGATEGCTGNSGGINLSAFSTTGSGATFAAASIYTWGSAGLGVVAAGEGTAQGPHAMDNVINTDVMLISFDAAKSLTSVEIGWNGTTSPTIIPSGLGTGSYTDSDLTVLAWMGQGTPGAVSGLATTGLVSAGWQVIGNYADVGSVANGGTAAISTSVTSSYWLVTAYDTAFGTTSSNGGTLGSTKNDAFKLVSVAGTTSNKTPEPGSLALLGAGLLGWVVSRKRKAAVAV